MSSCRVAISDTHAVMQGRSRPQLQCLESMNPRIPTTDASLDVSAILTGICALANVAAQNVKENHCGAPPKSVHMNLLYSTLDTRMQDMRSRCPLHDAVTY